MKRYAAIALLLSLIPASAEGQWQYVGTVWGDTSTMPVHRDSTITGIAVTVRGSSVVLTLWEPPLPSCEPDQLSAPLLRSTPDSGGAVTCQAGQTLTLSAEHAFELSDSLAVLASAAPVSAPRSTRFSGSTAAPGRARAFFSFGYTRWPRAAGLPGHVITFGDRRFSRLDQDAAPVLRLAKLLRDAARIAAAAGPSPAQ